MYQMHIYVYVLVHECNVVSSGPVGLWITSDIDNTWCSLQSVQLVISCNTVFYCRREDSPLHIQMEHLANEPLCHLFGDYTDLVGSIL